MAAMVTECGNVRIITQLIQQKDPQGAEVLSESGSTSMSSQLTPAQPKTFANTLPKALGVVQIVLGATQISFGIALTVAQEDLKKLTVKSGVYFWIGILLLLSGALLVEMEKRDHALLGRLCLLVNLLVSGASVVAVILHGTEIGEETVKDNICGGSGEYYCSSAKQVLVYGMNSVFIILSLLELAISLTAVVVVFKSTRQQSYRQMASR
ncbi:PREDICTED: membrane-spanning 4-domains subfamily A member 5 [Gekko japonicus]|uniref:Membrane-spanning 4-domains subfamily A member 5 n=1 Tax=Gekko japonicus TaxID=146911 RepID=A0ABM1JZI7_GEKJA|nr:PREDICTED: membrane-spanning 4-domains subfamily A member 5 [Gekko japonicus]